ncbi:MAG: metallophosphoesterase family protein [Verrucomicrobiota bacterium]
MKYAIVSDIHGNWEAFSAVLEDLETEGISNRFCLGDVVGYGADPVKCVDYLMQNDWNVIAGNHDEAISFPELLDVFSPLAREGVIFSTLELEAHHKTWLSELPHIIKGTHFELVHASLFEPLLWDYVVDNQAARRHFALQQCNLAFCGHTHVPKVWKKNKRISSHSPGARRMRLRPEVKYLINVGSVGQPRDRDPKACYVVFDAETQTVEFRRITYDVAQAQAKIRAAGLPEKLAKRLKTGR